MKPFIAILAITITVATTTSSYIIYNRYIKSISLVASMPKEQSLPEIDTKNEDISFSTTKMLGYESLLNETQIPSLSISGTIPAWLTGSFFINGPAQFELSSKGFTYWFDGFAMIHRFSCNNGTISYANKFLQSSYQIQSIKKGSLPGVLAREEKPSFFSKVAAFMTKRPKYDNTNSNITTIDDQVVALTETPHHIVFDPETIETREPFCYDDSLDGHVCTAHPIIDHTTGELFNVLTLFGTTSTYHIYKIDKNSKKRIPLCSIPASEPSYIHSFSLTQHYIILTLIPFVINPLDLLFSAKAFITHYRWLPERNTEFVVIDRQQGTIVNTFKTDPFFVFHHVNAYEQQHAIIIDLVSYPDSEITHWPEFDLLRSCDGGEKPGTLKRYCLNLKKCKVTSKVISSLKLESPRINEQYRSKHYSIAYAFDAKNMSLLKIHVHTGKTNRWQESNCYPGEPVFVAKPHAKQEDDGVILSCVLDAKNKNSFLLVLDAKTFKELGRATVPHHIPFSFHGIFLETI